MKVKLLGYTPNPIEFLAKIMRSSRTLEDASILKLYKSPEYYINLAIDSGHLSVLEHVPFTFSISDVSRVFTHQLVRHRIASYTQESQREVDPTKREDWYVTPKTIQECADPSRYIFGMAKIKEYYESFIDMGVPLEDARYFLPNATKTHIVSTMNVRELRHFFKLRLALPSQWEMRGVANLMLDEVMKISPTLVKGIPNVKEIN